MGNKRMTINITPNVFTDFDSDKGGAGSNQIGAGPNIQHKRERETITYISSSDRSEATFQVPHSSPRSAETALPLNIIQTIIINNNTFHNIIITAFIGGQASCRPLLPSLFL